MTALVLNAAFLQRYSRRVFVDQVHFWIDFDMIDFDMNVKTGGQNITSLKQLPIFVPMAFPLSSMIPGYLDKTF